MIAEQYRQQLKNRRYRGASPAFDEVAVGAFLRQARRHEQGCQRVQRALGLVLQDEQLKAVRIEAFRHGMLVLATPDPAVREQLRRRSRRIQQQLAKHVPGLQRLLVK